MDTTCGPVVVGVDGSQAALDAVTWAVDEAVERSVPLRLVHATGVTPQADQSPDDYRLEREYAETVLRAASTAERSAGRDVKVETEILWGSPESELVAESRGAEMVCVGSVGIGAIAQRDPGLHRGHRVDTGTVSRRGAPPGCHSVAERLAGGRIRRHAGKRKRCHRRTGGGPATRFAGRGRRSTPLAIARAELRRAGPAHNVLGSPIPRCADKSGVDRR
ncbi:universal stress protein [Mycobacterium doricum]|nr:universal stress protein [Mycolicibacterium doricum]